MYDWPKPPFNARVGATAHVTSPAVPTQINHGATAGRVSQAHGLTRPAAMLLAELERAKRDQTPERNLLTELTGNQSVHCNEKLFVPHLDKDKSLTWLFTVTCSMRMGPWCQLKRVFTLDPYLPEFSIVEVKAGHHLLQCGAQGCECESVAAQQVPSITVLVQFLSKNFGSFNQRLVFDFGVWPKVVRNLGVVVAPEQDLVQHLKLPAVHEEDSELVWLKKYRMIPVEPSSESQSHTDFPLPPNMAHNVEYGAFDHLEDVLTPDTYRRRLHMLLHIEEFERRRQMSRLTLHCDDIRSCLRASSEEPSQQTLSLPIRKELIEEASVLVGRGSKALVRIQPLGSRKKVLYEVMVESLKVDSVVLRVSSGLGEVLKREIGELAADVCFCFVDTYRYMHSAVDRVNLELVFPSRRHRPVSTLKEPRHQLLNCSQAMALHRILASSDDPPLLLLGPFGTGKTRTMAEAVKELCLKQARDPSLNIRILVCTHSNSAADHYINDYLHAFFLREMPSNKDCRPLRVCWEHRFASALSETVLKYCLINQTNGKFQTPTKQDVDTHRVIVTTLVTADVLTELKLPQGYFTHIFIDEAAQAMEVEATIPLCLADLNTMIVMAGDHLQLNPPILSKTSAKLGLGRSLLVRLSKQYPPDSCNKLLLLENYRSYEDIVEIPSAIFYESSLIANLKRPPSLEYSVHFYGVLGREEQAKDQPSFFNRAEAAEVAERVENLYNAWPCEFWGEATPSKICVLAPYPAQVREIRRLLRQRHLNAVRVEGVTNVQGLEFDALFISTVRTYNTMNIQTLDQNNLGFLSNPQLLNTAVTRARYYLGVVGDPNALCSVGENKVCWKHLLNKCNEHNTFHYRLPFDTLIKMIGGSHSNAAVPAPALRSNNPVQPSFTAAHPSPDVSYVTRFPQAVHTSAGHAAGIYGNPGFAGPPQRVSPVIFRSIPEVPGMNFRPAHPNLGAVPGYGLGGPRIISHPHPQTFLLSPSAPLGVPVRNAYYPNAIQPYAAVPPYLGSHPVPGHPGNMTAEVHDRIRSNQPEMRTPAFSSYSAVAQQAIEQVSRAQTPTGSVSSSEVSSNPSEAIPDDNDGVAHEVRAKQSKEVPDLRSTTSDDMLKQVKGVDRNLRLRKATLDKDKKSIEGLLSRGLGGAALLEQLKMQLTRVRQELEILAEQTNIQDKVNDMLGLDPTTDDLVPDTTSDLWDDNFQVEQDTGLDSVQTDEGAEDAIDLDTSEWFEARRRDPIVQEYIQAYERIMNQRLMDKRARKDPVQRVNGQEENDVSSACDERMESALDESVLQTPVPQPSKDAAYYRPIYEEYLDEEHVKEMLSTGDLLACTLQIESSSHGNTAVAKVADPTKPDVTIQTRTEINRALNRDVVAVQVTGFVQDDPNVPKGKVVAILKEVHHREVVCSCDLVDRNIMIPINKCNPRFVVVRNNDEIAIHGMENGRFYCKATVTETKGKLFVLRFMQWGATYRYPLGFVLRYFSATEDPRACLPVLAAEYGIHQKHSKQSQTELRKCFPVNWKIPEEEQRSRPRYTNVFTVDPEGSSELDDALSVDIEEDGTYKVGVHITDVSYFIPKDSALDKAAYAHGQSLYPGAECGQHVPMLPPHVTINLCSLLPGKNRLAVSAIFSFDADGSLLQKPRFHKSIVRSSCRLTYQQCQDILQGGAPADVSKRLQQSVLVLGSLARKMTSRRARGGCVPEGDWGETQQAIKTVEEFMLLTNLSVASQLLKCPQARGVVPLRRQLPPKVHSLRELLEKYTSQGLWPPHHLSLRCLCRSLEEDEKPCAEHVYVDVTTWEDISAALDGRNLEKLTDVLSRLCRSGLVADALSSLGFIQEKSSYVASSDLDPSLRGHFSLNATAYTHFTSPLRRYLDLVVHRIETAVLNGDPIPYSQEELTEICVHCNAMSARADAFEKHLSAVCVASLMKKESTWKTAKFDSVSAEQLVFTGRELEGLTPAQRSVNLRDLKPSSREWNKEEGELVLTWNVVELNLGACPASGGDGCVDTLDSNYGKTISRQLLKIPSATWVSFLDSVCAGNFEQMDTCRQAVNERALIAFEDRSPSTNHHLSAGTADTKGDQPYARVHTQFYRRRDQASVLLTGQTQQGFLQPTILAVRATSSVLCCIFHHRRPMEVFCEPLERSTRRTYSDVGQYQSVMVPLLTAESATSSVNSDFPYKVVLSSVSVKWTCDTPDKVWQGHFTVPQALCATHDIHFNAGDFLCVRVSRALESAVNTLPDSNKEEDKEHRIMHCRVTDVEGTENHKLPLSVTFKLTEKGCDLAEPILQAGLHSIELIPQSLPYRRMLSCVNSLGKAPELARSIFLRRDIPAYTARNPRLLDPSAVQFVDRLKLDEGQLEAVRRAVTSPLTLIQGPPGTGKTWTAVAITRQFVYQNSVSGKPGQVLYCAPSNQAVDVAARMLQKVQGLCILRVYGRQIESQTVKSASQVRFFPRNGPVGCTDAACEDVALHSRIRRPLNSHSARIIALEEEIAQLREDEHASSTGKEAFRDRLLQKIKEHRDVLDKAEQQEMANAQVILCTCTEAGSSRVRRHANIAHVIIDECSTCLETEVLVVLSSVGQRCQNIVFLGDHKQLAPVVQNKAARKLGLARSLFEVMFEGRANKSYVAYMLQTQYRMHPSIRQFPSEHFYQGQLKDAAQVTYQVRLDQGLVEGLWPAGHDVRLVFCHVVGQEESPQDCTGAEGREESKYNDEEVNKTVEVVEFLQSKGVRADEISVFTPYTAQRTRLARKLHNSTGPIEVLSVSSSQGSEQDFVIISTVRSLPPDRVLTDAGLPWQVGHLGFLTDEHQINVAITRARHGLIIIGNRELLAVHEMWRSLLNHYQTLGCIVDKDNWPQ